MADLFTAPPVDPPTAIELHSRGLRCGTCGNFELEFAGAGEHMCSVMGLIMARPGDFCSRHTMFKKGRNGS